MIGKLAGVPGPETNSLRRLKAAVDRFNANQENARLPPSLGELFSAGFGASFGKWPWRWLP
jgi:hypothetical protein